MHDNKQSELKNLQLREKSLTLFTLFTTTGTLLCCALPIIFVTLGFGASIAAMTSSLPFLVTLSHHKVWVFLFSGFMLLVSGWLMYRPGRTCPMDSAHAQACQSTNKWNRRIYWSSVAIWLTGFTAAYILLPVRIWLDL